ncbi:MAG TPA: hypothetical protein VJ809_04025 [Pirellulales bacterium]|jgi:hypothetical protein|nr:hypothetical protein [Pirellulales bacterium]
MERFARMLNSAFGLSRVFFLTLVGGTLGCGQAEPEVTSNETDADNLPAVASATPQEAIHEFMMAYKVGDEGKAAALLTEKSRQETARTGKSVSPPVSPNMQFKVGEVNYPPDLKDAAHVACYISEVGPEGEKIDSDVVWFVRKEPKGWRVAGIAMKPFPDLEAVLYNFENQDDMDRKFALIEAEFERREIEQAKATLMQAQQPMGNELRK